MPGRRVDPRTDAVDPTAAAAGSSDSAMAEPAEPGPLDLASAQAPPVDDTGVATPMPLGAALAAGKPDAVELGSKPGLRLCSFPASSTASDAGGHETGGNCAVQAGFRYNRLEAASADVGLPAKTAAAARPSAEDPMEAAAGAGGGSLTKEADVGKVAASAEEAGDVGTPNPEAEVVARSPSAASQALHAKNDGRGTLNPSLNPDTNGNAPASGGRLGVSQRVRSQLLAVLDTNRRAVEKEGVKRVAGWHGHPVDRAWQDPSGQGQGAPPVPLSGGPPDPQGAVNPRGAAQPPRSVGLMDPAGKAPPGYEGGRGQHHARQPLPPLPARPPAWATAAEGYDVIGRRPPSLPPPPPRGAAACELAADAAPSDGESFDGEGWGGDSRPRRRRTRCRKKKGGSRDEANSDASFSPAREATRRCRC